MKDKYRNLRISAVLFYTSSALFYIATIISRKESVRALMLSLTATLLLFAGTFMINKYNRLRAEDEKRANISQDDLPKDMSR